MELGTLDIILLAMIIGYAFWGLFKGFVNQIASILAIIAGVWCAFKFTTFLAAYLKEWFSLAWDESTINILAFASILVFDDMIIIED